MVEKIIIEEALLLKYFSNKVNPKERLLVDQWLDASEENRRIAEQVYYIKYSADTVHALQAVDAKNDLGKVWKKIRHHDRQPWWIKMQRAAAVFVILLGISGFIYQYFSEKGQPVIASNKPASYNEILVPYGSKTMIVLSDSTKVWLNSGARLKYPNSFDNFTRDVYLQGEAYFEVVKNKQQPFLVHSNGMDIRVLGTKFNVKANADDDFVEAVLLEGAIEVLGVKKTDGHSHDVVILEPGQKLTLHVDKDEYKLQSVRTDGMFIPEMDHAKAEINKASITKNANMELSTAWTKNKLVFAKERFEVVKIKLERWYGVSIEVKDPEILNYHFTGTFDNETIEQAMSAFSTVAGCTFRINKNKVTVTK